MLTSLHISNYALISSLDIRFQGGFSVITGETGAGKSIILGALSLILGQRADTRAIMPGKQKCVVEAIFNIAEYPGIRPFFDINELDAEGDECYIRREITASGKSRAFINDTPVGLGLLKELSVKLIDIHSQHENLMLSNPGYQLNVVDTLAGNIAVRSEYVEAYQQWQKIVSDHAHLKIEEARAATESDFVRFQFEQLDTARLIPDEQLLLETELERLTHLSEIKSDLEATTQLLDGEDSALPLLKESLNSFQKVRKYLPEGDEQLDRFNSAFVELKELAGELRRFHEELTLDPERLELVSNRLSELYGLQKKHKVNTVEALIVLRDAYEQQLQQFESYSDEILKLEKECELAFANMRVCAARLTESRRGILAGIEQSMVMQLSKLGMPHIRFKIRHQDTGDFRPSGSDQITFMFSANKSRDLQPVESIASGGEISRLMLSVKALIAGRTELPTILFDEIDSGVSGEIAYRMSEIMSDMGRKMQVITITHLPQIAARGSHHYRVYKDESGARAETKIEKLDENARVGEIAAMLSGVERGEAAIRNARELLGLSFS
jgi:DNA repair protein RecN (Recombination protein N)